MSSKVGFSFITSVTGPLFSKLGNDSLIFESSGNFLILLNIPFGISIFDMSAILCPISVKSEVSSDNSNLFIEPNAFPKTGISYPLTFSKSNAGPLSYIVRRKISANSSSEFTSAEIFFNSPAFSKTSTNS